jgi:hypothetical protein
MSDTTNVEGTAPVEGESNVRVIDGQVFRRVKDTRKRRRNMLAAVLDDETKSEFLTLLGKVEPGKPAAEVIRELVVRHIGDMKERLRVADETKSAEKAA